MTNLFHTKRLQVPGLLSDEGMAEGLKAYQQQARTTTEAAPPPTSAVEFADEITRIGSEMSSRFTKTTGQKVPGIKLPSPEALREVRRTEATGEAIAGAVQSSPIGAIAGLVDKAGTLTPEESAAEDERRAAGAVRDQQALEEDLAAQADVRAMTPEQREAAGIPESPFSETMREASAEADIASAAARIEAEKELPSPTQHTWYNILQTATRSAAQTGVGGLTSLVDLWELGPGMVLSGGDIKQSDAGAFLDGLDKAIVKMLPGDPAQSRDYLTELAAGGGSMAAFMIAGYASRLLRLGAQGLTAFGVGVGANAAYEDAERFNAVGLQKYISFILGGAIGATEAIPIDRMFYRANHMTGGAVERLLRGTMAASRDEFIQEMFQSMSEDLLAKVVYDPERELDPVAWVRQGTVGAIVGGGAGVAATLLEPRQQTPEQLTKAAEEAFEAEQARIETILGEAGAEGEVQPPSGAPPTGTQVAPAGPAPVVGDAVQQIVEGVKVQRAAVAQTAPAAAAAAQQDVVLNPEAPVEQQVAVQSAPVTETPEFKTWFAESKAVDAMGAPLRVLHATAKEFTAFDISFGGQATGSASGREGFFFTDAPAVANAYNAPFGQVREGARTMPVYLSLQNPLIVKREKGSRRVLDERPKEKAIEKAKAEGHDGVIFEDFVDSPQSVGRPARTYVAFEPTQIKSAIANVGTFDPTNPDINQNIAQPVVNRQQLDAIQLDPSDVVPLASLEAGLTGPIEIVVKAAKAYAAAAGIPHRRQRDYVRVDTGRAARIAQAYQDMKHQPSDPAVLAAYRALAEETIAQYQFVKATGIKIEAIQPGQPDPYPAGPRDVLKDIAAGHIWYFPTEQGFGTEGGLDTSDNPLLEKTGETSDNGSPMVVNDLFRVVHDFFGHGLEGSGFGARGEENAWQSHMRLFSASAVPAMTSETRGQNSWVNYGPHGAANRAKPKETIYADQKSGIMPSWTWSEGLADSRANDLDAPVTTADVNAFHAALSAAKAASPYGAVVNVYSKAKYARMKLFLTPDGLTGFALDGDSIVSVFSHSNAPRGRLQTIIDTAVANGGRKLDAFDTGLPAMYARFGFREVKRTPWNEKYAPKGWPADLGKPDIVDMEYDGDIERSMAAYETKTTAFEGWFGDSKVVDENGDPLVVYHGGSSSIKAFRVNEQGLIFATSDPALAGDYASARYAGSGSTYPVFVSLQNPLLVDRATDGTAQRELVRRAREAGNDGLILRNADDSVTGKTQRPNSTIVIAFSPTQIKSVYNRGAFDPEDPDILRMAGTSVARQPYFAEPTRPTRGIPSPADQRAAAVPDDIRLTTIARNFTRLFSAPVRQGRLRTKGAASEQVMGEYNKRSGVIRLRTATDFSTLVHEAGHALNDSMGGAVEQFTQANDSELRALAMQSYGGDLSNAPAETRRREGFAEFFRIYVTNPAYLHQNHADMTQRFEAALQQADPTFLDGLVGITRQFELHQQMSSTQLLRSMVVSGERESGFAVALKEIRDNGFKSWFDEKVRRNVQWAVNRQVGLNVLTSRLLNAGQDFYGNAIELKRADDPRVIAQLAPNSGNLAMNQVKDGVIAYRGTDPVTRSLRAGYMLALGLDPNVTPRQIDNEREMAFRDYLVALRITDEYRRLSLGLIRNAPARLQLGEARRIVKEYSDQYDTFAEAAEIVNEYAMGLWHKRYEAGLIDKDTYDKGRDRQFYVPLQRDMSDKLTDLPSGISFGASALMKGPAFKGSQRDILDPLSVLMQMTVALEKEIASNDVAKALAVLSDRAGRAGALVERIPANQLTAEIASVGEVARQLAGDPDMSEEDGAELMSLLSGSIEKGNIIQLFRSKQASTAGENIIFFWENGKVAALQLHDAELGRDVVDMLNGLGRETMNFGLEMVAATSTLFRTAIIAHPAFLVSNFIRGEMQAWVMTEGYVPFVSGIKGVSEELRQSRWAKAYNRSRGLFGGAGSAGLRETTINRSLKSLRRTGFRGETFGEPGFAGAAKGWARLIEVTETGGRMGVFEATYKRGIADGLTLYEASIEAAYIATDMMDYGLHGNRMLAARRTIPFLNAQIQGFYKFLRTLGGNEVAQRKGLMFALGAYFKNINGLDLSRAEKAQLRVGRKAWLKMTALGLFSALLHFIFEDDPDYQDADEFERATNWVIPGWVVGGKHGTVIDIPKPFEWALVANIFERGLEYAGGDETAKDRLLRSFGLTMVPPVAPPLIETLTGLTANYDFFTGRPITPEYMMRLDPELRYTEYTSSIARRLGEITGQSPMVVDHILSSMGAAAYTDLARVFDAVDPRKPSLDLEDMPLLRRFYRDVRGGSQTSQDFYARAQRITGTLSRAAASYKTMLERGQEIQAAATLADLPADDRAYALLMTHFDADAKRLSPYHRAVTVTGIISALRREMQSDIGLQDTGLKDMPERIELTRGEAAKVDEILSELSRREMRNTMIAMGEPGWRNKKITPIEETLDMLMATSPEAYDEYNRRTVKQKVYQADAVFEAWPDVRDRLVQDGEFAILDDLVATAGVVF